MGIGTVGLAAAVYGGVRVAADVAEAQEEGTGLSLKVTHDSRRRLQLSS